MANQVTRKIIGIDVDPKDDKAYAQWLIAHDSEHNDIVMNLNGILNGSIILNEAVEIRDNGVSIGIRPAINFIAAANLFFSIADNPAQNEVVVGMAAVVGLKGLQQFTASGTFNVPLGVNAIWARLWGGGGGGGGASEDATTNRAGGGGGAGEYSEALIPTIPGEGLTITIGGGGAGGTGATGTGNAGANGALTKIERGVTLLASANGGTGGAGGANAGADGAGGAGGTGGGGANLITSPDGETGWAGGIYTLLNGLRKGGDGGRAVEGGWGGKGAVNSGVAGGAGLGRGGGGGGGCAIDGGGIGADGGNGGVGVVLILW